MQLMRLNIRCIKNQQQCFKTWANVSWLLIILNIH